MANAVLFCGILTVLVSVSMTSCGFTDTREENDGDVLRDKASSFVAGWAESAGSDMDGTSGLPIRIRRKRDGMLMMLIPSGTFQMGALPNDNDASSGETPRHWVSLPYRYYADECHVTVAMWRRYCSEVGVTMPQLRPEAGESHPMHHISWWEAHSYAKWAGVDLLTEEQWERAARGGVEGQVYPWGNIDRVNLRNGRGDLDGFDRLAPVKSYSPNSFGLYDVVGNIQTWCADRFKSYDGRTLKDAIPPPTSTGRSMVVRGGAFWGDAGNFRLSRRNDLPEQSRCSVGVRCGRSVR